MRQSLSIVFLFTSLMTKDAQYLFVFIVHFASLKCVISDHVSAFGWIT